MQLNYHKIINFLIITLVIVITISCGKPPLIDKSMDVSETAWNVKDKFKTEVLVDDTISSYNFYINVRNTTDYKNSNFFLFIKTTFPNGQKAIDTLECIITDFEGKWLGKGNGKIKDSKILLKQHAIFPMKGSYQFEIEHAMRVETVSGIKSIGLRIEKNNTK
ncbi:MAG: gliding motility lipoprotein GldH [Bacteroidetes bacterium]|nr:gliding motility lipoprotein GldH [Bacteroidota bacterium]